MKKLTLPLKEIPTTRFHSHFRGTRTDIQSMLRYSLRYGGDYIPLKKKSRQYRPPPLTVLCDISGSMERYSRMLLHFIHALTNDRDRVQSILFGTRLTNITRLLHQKVVDAALKTVSAAIDDWSGGTRIGLCLEEFNKRWSRRTLARSQTQIMILPGCDAPKADTTSHAVRDLPVPVAPTMQRTTCDPKSTLLRTWVARCAENLSLIHISEPTRPY